MKRIISMLLILASIVCLAACAKDDGIPEGMQLLRGGEDLGYYMYIPEEWVPASMGEVSAAYVSSVDNSSVTYVECPMPEVTVEEYFTESLKEFPTQPTLVEECKTVTFGNADDARMYVFDYEYKEHKFRTMQIFSKYDGRFGIFTFTSFRENMSSDKVTQYEYFAEKRQAIIDNFKYVKRSASHPEPEYERDADGYKLISDKSVAKYSLWVPDDFTVKYSSGITEATLADGSSITMSVATNTGVVVTEYWAARKAELEALFGTVNVISADTPTALGDSNAAFSYEYTYTYNGEVYHVYQILAITTFDGFVFTYTAKDINYSKHIDVIKKICDKVTY